MVKAGALYYAIFISFLVALLGGFFITNVWMHHAHAIGLLTEQRLVRNVHSALLLAEEIPDLVPDQGTKEIDLYDDEKDIVFLTKTPWGGFCLLKAVAKTSRIQKSAIALCGKDVFANENYALYLADNNQYLSLSGATVIKGDCYVPKLGLRRAYIEGYSFTGTSLTEGKIFNSKSQIPACNPIIKNSNAGYLNGTSGVGDSTVDASLLQRTNGLTRSFYKKTIVFYSNQWITLSDQTLQGNIRIISGKGITITPTAQINHVILYAPKVDIEKGFTGSLQVFASDTIRVQEGVNLTYPSFLAILESHNSKALISIGKGSNIAGDIALTVTATEKIQAECLINPTAVITGRVYCGAQLDLKGSVNGTVYSQAIILRTPGSIYENHLLNATINVNQLPASYSGTLINEPVERYKMIQWER
jgi:hypothetical protein